MALSVLCADNLPIDGQIMATKPQLPTRGSLFNFRRDIGRRLIAKTGHIIKKFVVEIEDAERDFRIKSENPPVAENLPPISGL